MISYPGGIILKAVKRVTGMEATRIMSLACEDMAYNYFANPIARFADDLLRRYPERPDKCTFDHIARPVMYGMIKGARRPVEHFGFRFSGEQKLIIYGRMSSFLGDGFPQKDLDDIVDICMNARAEEVDSAIRLAGERGIHSATYVKGIIRNQRRIKQMQSTYRNDRYKKVDDEPLKVDTLLDAKKAKDAWNKKLEEAKSNEESAAATQAAKRKAGLR